MRIVIVVAVVLMLAGVYVAVKACGSKKTLRESEYIAAQGKIVKQKLAELVAAGRITEPEYLMADTLLATYGWHEGTCTQDGREQPCYFGAYTFSPEAFEQAKRVFVVYGQMAEGSELLIDVGAGAFDKSIVGYHVPYLTYCSLHGGKLHHCGEDFRDATVVEFIDKHTVRLNKKAKWDAEVHALTITPPDYQDMCQCTVGQAQFVPPR